MLHIILAFRINVRYFMFFVHFLCVFLTQKNLTIFRGMFILHN